MPIQKGYGELVCVAIDKDKGSQYALKWAVDNLVGKGKSITLLHVKQKSSPAPRINDAADAVSRSYKGDNDKELFLPFRCFCTRKDIRVNEILLEDMDIARALCDYLRLNLVENMVVGAPTKNGFVRFKGPDVASSVSKGAPDFCNVYTISKGKVSSVRNASGPPPNQFPQQSPNQHTPALPEARFIQGNGVRGGLPDKSPAGNPYLSEEMDSIRSPFTRANNKSYGELSLPDTDISFISSGRPSTDRFFPDNQDMFAPRLSSGSETEMRLSFGSPFSGTRTPDSSNSFAVFSNSTNDSGSMSWSSSGQSQDEVEAEMRRLKYELRQTMDMYSTACKEALLAKQKALELQRWKVEEQQKLEEARLSEEAAIAIAEKEKAKCKAAIEAAEAAQRIAELEAQKRRNAEMKAFKEAEERKRVMDSLAQGDVRYRRYTIDEIETATQQFSDSQKIGEGGYGPVYKCNLDHTPVAIKVLRPDASQGRSQFQQEQTGMLGIKSDIYSLGVMLLQLITAKPPMGLTHHIGRAIERGTFKDMLDPAVPDWPVEEALSFAKLALKCTELRRKDRPDLATVVLPELERLRALGEETMPNISSMITSGSPNRSTIQSRKSGFQVSGTSQQSSGHDSETNRLSAPTFSDRDQV
ncbi:OLC1v1035796C2 [Oldenlandia corymbosa var. corymbosa]|uniref:RING-type E3 ubiquitin transferase n=1 Tax=Oldenlandia corymbosa var. corymbosa TaxID=529605 RepID=A0AAV1CUG6_OLDCO|nr:OLC1v1035796C2 [Oldenlandia corymbosa var. corymbosa]